jgi:putative tricarboxylic transport membrane protein
VREIVEILRKEGLIDFDWMVRNEPAGESIGAMAYLMQHKGESNVIAAMTPTWITSPLTVAEAPNNVTELTPIMTLLTEPEVFAVAADSPYQTIGDFVEAAKKEPGKLVQCGGPTSGSDALAGYALQAATGTKWTYLPIPESGQRITALLNGDAQLLEAPTGYFEQFVKSGDVRVLAVVGDQRSAMYPDVPTVKEAGFAVDFVMKFRGLLAPPDIPADALQYYQDLFSKLVETDGWKEYVEANGYITNVIVGDAFGDYLVAQIEATKINLEKSGGKS